MLGSFIHREQYSLDLIPFDGDLLSMEAESAFKVSTCPRRTVLWFYAVGVRSRGSQRVCQSLCIRDRPCRADVA